MKKILLIAGLITMSAIGSYAQGLVSIAYSAAGIVSTNGSSLGKATTSGAYDFELLTATSLNMFGNTNLLNSSTLALWSDTGVSGTIGFGLNAGKITSAASASANNWVAPGLSYDNQQSAIIVGWSTAEYGTTWAGVVAAIDGSGLAGGGYFGVTSVSLDYAGGGASSLPAVNIWANTTPTSMVLNLVVVPEPTTIALASLGGMALLAFRRRKA